MRPVRHFAAFSALMLASREAAASDLDASGALVFAADALRTYSFEAPQESSTSVLSRLAWTTGGTLSTSALTDTTWREAVTAEAQGLHGEGALRVTASA